MNITLLDSDAVSPEILNWVLTEVHDNNRLPIFYIGPSDPVRRVLLEAKARTYAIPETELLYVESNLKTIIVHTTSDAFEMMGSMKDAQDLLGEQFYRCHRGFLVNLSHVRSYGNNSVSLDNGETILLSKKRYRDFDSAYRAHLASAS